MANVCSGEIRVEGDYRDVEEFCKYFIFEDYEGVGDKQYFARSFTHLDWEEFKKSNLGDDIVNFTVDFDWSAHSCLIDGYPNGKECITLVEACKRHRLDVVIKTVEPGCGIEEHITCDKNGNLKEECEEMPTYICTCGNERDFPSSYGDSDLEEEFCYECDNNNWRKKEW